MVLRAYPEELLNDNKDYDIDISKLTEEIKNLKNKIESLSYERPSRSYQASQDDTLIIIIAFILALLIFVFILYILRWRR